MHADFALGYAIIDLSVGAATGTTLTERIAEGVENSTKLLWKDFLNITFIE